MRVFPLAVTLVLLAGPAFAQGINLAPRDKNLTSEEIERNKEIDEAYKAANKKIPEQKPVADPWGNVRASGSTQAPAASAKASSQKTSKTSKTQAPAR